MFSKAFWAATAERVVRTFAATLAGLGVGDVTDTVGSSLVFIDKVQAAGWTSLATLLICLAAAGVNSPGPSLGTEVPNPSTGA